MFNFKNKVVVITGAEKGIGKSIACAFSSLGAKVVIIGIDEEEGKRTADELAKDGNACFIKMNIANEAEVATLAGKVEQTFGPADILVNNAGIYFSGSLEDTDAATWDRVMNVNIRGAMLVTRALIPQMLAKNYGVIVSVGSEAGLCAFKNQVAYNVSKAAIIHFTKSIAIDFADRGIRANTVCPGTTYTPLVENELQNAKDAALARKQMEDRPLGRLGKAEETANAVLCLAADEIGYATGAVLSVDGGYAAR